jgi:tyrosyl-tRNA synthetase
MRLAREIVTIFHDAQAAEQAEEQFKRVFQQGSLPENMPEIVLTPGQSVMDVLLAAGLTASKSEARRLLEQNGVRLDGETLTDPAQPFPHPGVLQAGKRRFVRVRQ